MCGFFDAQNGTDEPINLFSDEEIDHIIIAVFSRLITTRRLDLSAYKKVARKLFDGVTKGYGNTIFEDMDATMLEALRENVYVFSAAKQYQQVKEMSSLLTNRKGVASFTEFKKQATQIFKDYNENYLRTEYNSAIAQGRAVSQWEQIVKDKAIMPMLTYHTVGDARVRPTHQELDGINRPVGDKFWDMYFPPNGWNCRCTTLQTDDAEKTDMRGFKPPDDVPDIFRFNAGKEKIIFSPKHPYFDVAKRDKPFAKVNFDLPLP